VARISLHFINAALLVTKTPYMSIRFDNFIASATYMARLTSFLVMQPWYFKTATCMLANQIQTKKTYSLPKVEKTLTKTLEYQSSTARLLLLLI
jgi:hypothetical protein